MARVVARRAAALAFLVFALFSGRAASAAPPVAYEVDLTHPNAHLISVVMTVASAPAKTEIQFPAWNALYQIRDFVRNVQNLEATCSSAPLALHPVDVNSWRTGDAPCTPLVVRYQVYANEPGVFSSELIQDHAFLNPAQILFYVPAQRAQPCVVRYILPPGWNLATLLPGAGPDFTAPDYDALADSPVEAGQFQAYSFRQDGGLYRIIVRGDPGSYSSQRLLDSIQKIAAAETALMQGRPCARYTFIFHFLDAGGGGMEHACGTAIAFPAPLLKSGWQGLENTIAHEFFHLWNVKRIRPQGLVPIDYVHVEDTRDLWFSEGVTSTYAQLVLLRADLITRDEFYAHLASAIAALQARLARHFESVELSGIDGWLEKYPDYNRPVRSISYYNKGELLGDLLDLEILHASGGGHSLDDLMRKLYANAARPFTDDDLETEIAALGPSPDWVHSFFADDVDGTSELDYQQYLAYAGLKLQAIPSLVPDWGFEAARDFTGVMRVTSVEPSGDAARSGIETGDVLVALDGQKLFALPQEVEGVAPDRHVKLQVMRNGRAVTLKFDVGSTGKTNYQIEEMPGAPPQALAIRSAWLTGRSPGIATAASAP